MLIIPFGVFVTFWCGHCKFSLFKDKIFASKEEFLAIILKVLSILRAKKPKLGQKGIYFQRNFNFPIPAETSVLRLESGQIWDIAHHIGLR